jgi:hypothetical protein
MSAGFILSAAVALAPPSEGPAPLLVARADELPTDGKGADAYSADLLSALFALLRFGSVERRPSMASMLSPPPEALSTHSLPTLLLLLRRTSTGIWGTSCA